MLSFSILIDFNIPKKRALDLLLGLVLQVVHKLGVQRVEEDLQQHYPNNYHDGSCSGQTLNPSFISLHLYILTFFLSSNVLFLISECFFSTTGKRTVLLCSVLSSPPRKDISSYTKIICHLTNRSTGFQRELDCISFQIRIIFTKLNTHHFLLPILLIVA